MTATLSEIQNEWSINDLADAHEMIEWHNARTLDAQRQQERKQQEAAR